MIKMPIVSHYQRQRRRHKYMNRQKNNYIYFHLKKFIPLCNFNNRPTRVLTASQYNCPNKRRFHINDLITAIHASVLEPTNTQF